MTEQEICWSTKQGGTDRGYLSYAPYLLSQVGEAQDLNTSLKAGDSNHLVEKPNTLEPRGGKGEGLGMAQWSGAFAALLEDRRLGYQHFSQAFHNRL